MRTRYLLPVLITVWLGCASSEVYRPARPVKVERFELADTSLQCSPLTAPTVISAPRATAPKSIASQRHTEGFAVVKALVGNDGTVKSVAITETSNADFAAHVAGAVFQYRYGAALCNGRPVEFIVSVRCTYRVL